MGTIMDGSIIIDDDDADTYIDVWTNMTWHSAFEARGKYHCHVRTDLGLRLLRAPKDLLFLSLPLVVFLSLTVSPRKHKLPPPLNYFPHQKHLDQKRKIFRKTKFPIFPSSQLQLLTLLIRKTCFSTNY